MLKQKAAPKGRLPRLLWAVLAVAALVLPGCGRGGEPAASAPSGETGPYYSFEDASGATVTLPEKPETVAVLFSSFADVWKTAGGDIAITVGESVERGFAGESAVLVDSGNGQTINSELLIASQPDFVIATADLAEQVNAVSLLREAGIPAALFHVETVDEYLAMLKVCTDITGNGEAYETYGTAVKQEIDGLLASLPDPEARPKILFVRAGTKYSATKAKTAENNFVCVMLKELGTDNIAEKAPLLLDGLSFEEVLTNQPDYVFISTMGNEEAARAYMDSVLAEETWQSLDAVREGRVAYLPKDLFQYKPNARWAEAYRYLADLLYPGEG